MLLHHGGEEEYVWNIGHLLRYLLVVPSPIIEVKEKLQFDSGNIAN